MRESPLAPLLVAHGAVRYVCEALPVTCGRVLALPCAGGLLTSDPWLHTCRGRALHNGEGRVRFCGATDQLRNLEEGRNQMKPGRLRPSTSELLPPPPPLFLPPRLLPPPTPSCLLPPPSHPLPLPPNLPPPPSSPNSTPSSLFPPPFSPATHLLPLLLLQGHHLQQLLLRRQVLLLDDDGWRGRSGGRRGYDSRGRQSDVGRGGQSGRGSGRGSRYGRR